MATVMYSSAKRSRRKKRGCGELYEIRPLSVDES